ncbi:hypothetical protein [Streptomyces europaeiscabiei]|uniref:hypothetical protein n=1 Tax=Streptomyces europaeiscabiei TaxID=146819 RepID=UPI002E11DEA9|nr:hypothetical protein OHB30_22820 [Streptomyces europaeiscabiei]
MRCSTDDAAGVRAGGALKSFLSYTAGDEGQKVLPGIHYAPLPESVATEVRKVVGELS